MAYLTFDTSTKVLAVALAINEKILVEQRLNLQDYTHSEYLMPLIKDSLRIADIEKEDLSAIGIVKGPGSFTGLRIGLAVAKGLSIALNTEIYAYTSLEAMAANHIGSREKILATLPAQRGEVYGALFDVSRIRPIILGEYFIGKPAEVLPAIISGHDNIKVVGEGYLKFKNDFDIVIGDKLVVLNDTQIISSAAGIFELLKQDVVSKDNRANVLELKPFYMRLSAAEEQRRKM